MAAEVAVLCYLAVPGNLPGEIIIGGDNAKYIHPAIAGVVYYFYNQMLHAYAAA